MQRPPASAAVFGQVQAVNHREHPIGIGGIDGQPGRAFRPAPKVGGPDCVADVVIFLVRVGEQERFPAFAAVAAAKHIAVFRRIVVFDEVGTPPKRHINPLRISIGGLNPLIFG